MNDNWNWERFWSIFGIIIAALVMMYFIAAGIGMNFFVLVALALGVFFGVSALTVVIMWIIPKFEKWGRNI